MTEASLLDQLDQAVLRNAQLATANYRMKAALRMIADDPRARDAIKEIARNALREPPPRPEPSVPFRKS